jgi:hypothetical protein
LIFADLLIMRPHPDHLDRLDVVEYLIAATLLLRLGNSCFPGLGPTVKMHDGNDEDGIASDLIDDSIWKAFCPATPGSF